jgi:alpha-beta hydrolase superfamily lysophospholipase
MENKMKNKIEIKTEQWTFPATNGEGDIHARAWLIESPVAVIQLAHGMSEHSGRYDEFARFLCARGFSVVANDHAGHGLSVHSHLGSFSKKTGGFDCAVNDLDKLFSLAEEKTGPLPRILFGHSMGSILAGLYAERFSGLAALVICGTPAKIESSRLFALIAGFITTFRGHSAPSPLLERLTESIAGLPLEEQIKKRDWLSRDEEVIRNFSEDPLCGFDYTAGGYATMLKAYHYMYSNKWGRLIPDIPILATGGAADPKSDNGQGPTGYAVQLKRTGHTQVDLKLFPEMRHEVLNEFGREEVYEFFTNWFSDKLPT